MAEFLIPYILIGIAVAMTAIFTGAEEIGIMCQRWKISYVHACLSVAVVAIIAWPIAMIISASNR